MPNRILREGILTSPKVGRLGWAEEVFYRRLMSVVDDFGRYFADHGMLRAACYPRQLNKVSDSDVGKWLHACVAADLVRVYPAQDGERYLEIANFGQQVRAKKSRFPDMLRTCIADATQTLANAHLDVSVFVSEDVCGAYAPTAAPSPPPESKAKKPRKSGMPADFAVSDRVRVWATEKGFDRLDDHLDAFRRKVAANGYTYVDWDSAFMEAVRQDWAKLRNQRPSHADIARVTVPGSSERDPALVKADQDDLKAAPIPKEIREQLNRLKGKVFQ